MEDSKLKNMTLYCEHDIINIPCLYIYKTPLI